MTITPDTWGDARSNARAIVVMCIGIFCLVVNDAWAKWLTDFYTPVQIVFMRNLLALPIITAIVLAIGGPTALRTHQLRLHAVRGLFLVTGAFGFFLGLSILPLAEATSLIFASPIFITALSVPLLREAVGWRRWTAVVVGFIGVLIIVRPGGEAFQPASLFIVGTAFLFALVMISARWIDRGETVWTMMFYVVLFPLLFSALLVPFFWRSPDVDHLTPILGMAVFGTLGMAFLTQAFRMAPAAIVAPFDYTALIWASLLGWLIWNEIPGIWTYTGAVVIIASGVYIVWRETRISTR